MHTTTIGHTRTRLTEAEIPRIAATEDPAVRNLLITQSYADLADRLLALLGTDQTWCTFAIWASNTAGVSIRCHELPHAVDRLLQGAEHHTAAIIDAASSVQASVGDPGAPIHRHHVERLVRRALARVSEHIAHGNTLVFRELAPLFVRLLDVVEADGPPSATDVPTLLASIGVPDDPHVHTAFESYATAFGERGDSMRAQLVLTGNIAAVLHEQQRLQDDVAAALDAGLLDVVDLLDDPSGSAMPERVLRWLAVEIREHVEARLERLWEHVATRLLMTLTTPDEDLHLGRDVPPPGGLPMFPEALADLDHPPLTAMMDEWDPTGGTGVGSAAGDWAVLHDRMGYIVNLFRSRQRVLSLTASPFTADQLACIDRGDVPDGL